MKKSFRLPHGYRLHADHLRDLVPLIERDMTHHLILLCYALFASALLLH